MTLRVSTTPEADAQVRAIGEWWQENRRAARDLFLHELAAVFETIGHTPHLGRVYRQSPVPGTRRVLLKRCRYHVYFRRACSRNCGPCRLACRARCGPASPDVVGSSELPRMVSCQLCNPALSSDVSSGECLAKHIGAEGIGLARSPI